MKEIVRNEQINATDETLNDLPVNEEQAEDAKGGTDQFSVNFAPIKFAYKPQKPDGSLD